MTTVQFTKEQLFADLNKDGIAVAANKITKAKNGDGDAMNDIGWEYHDKKKKYDKAMAWYRLAAVKNNYAAQNSIGVLYGQGLGVPQDDLVALEWYLKAAIQNNKYACVNIGIHFDHGYGVPVNKYKALEWYTKCGREPDNVAQRFDELINQGIRLTQQDKNKSIEQLIIETEDIFWEARAKAKAQSKEETAALQQLTTKLQQESIAKGNKIKSLEEEVKTFRAIAEDKQQEINTHLQSIDQYKRKEQMINNELQALKQANHTFTVKMEAKESVVNALQNENKVLRMLSDNSSPGTTKRTEELERSNQGLERMLEQERQLKDGQIELVKEKMEISLEKEKQKRNELERKYRAIKRELRNMKISPQTRISPKQIAIKNEKYEDNSTNSSDNKTDYDTEYDSAGSDDNNDINYDTPNEENGDDDEHENDLNYDSDEQPKNRKKIPPIQSASGSRR